MPVMRSTCTKISLQCSDLSRIRVKRFRSWTISMRSSQEDCLSQFKKVKKRLKRSWLTWDTQTNLYKVKRRSRNKRGFIRRGQLELHLFYLQINRERLKITLLTSIRQLFVALIANWEYWWKNWLLMFNAIAQLTCKEALKTCLSEFKEVTTILKLLLSGRV